MREFQLTEVGKIVTGKTPKTSRPEYFGGNMPFVTPSDMQGGRMIESTGRSLTADGTATVKKSVIPRHAVMVSCIGSDMGKTYLSNERCVTNQQINSIIVDRDKFDPLFIYYNLSGRRSEIRNAAAGAAQPILNKTEFGKILVEAPLLEEQREIADTLGALDDKIELNRKMAATLEEMARALYRSWFVDFDPVHARAEGRAPAHMDAATAALFPDRFGEDGLPVGWEMSTIGSVAEIVGGSTPSTKESRYWGIGENSWATPKDLSNLGQAFLFETERSVTSFGLAKITSGLSPAGTLLLSSRAPIGYLALTTIPVAVNQGFIAIRETANISGIEAYFWCLENMDLIHANANGSTFQEISKKNFRPLAYILGAASVRAAFNKQAGLWFARMKALMDENRNLITLRDTILPRLMSGELRVGAARELVEEVA